ncbi:putative acetyltransferase [Amphibacillus marinus]|uniref:Putative acetyltransferase n=1 Tax=Amphibacillus marinus TaxID=872970 RepID=A0A1H8KE64_9BACI|nr:GNAT family N-acetyltransferase [Amphibacillus marinus]SEN91240.1 putative acetyltransferase [Amphibacillus marinus]
MEIKQDNLTRTAVINLINEHLQAMAAISPPESTHAFDINKLKHPTVTFWTIWDQGQLAGCGALKELDRKHGELKSMRTAQNHLRKGVSSRLLTHIIDQANQRGYQRLSLETGAMDAFAPARLMYEKFGFNYCEPFADYRHDPNSLFMTKELVK